MNKSCIRFTEENVCEHITNIYIGSINVSSKIKSLNLQHILPQMFNIL